MAADKNVIIIGLGLAGLSAARALSNRGLDILLMDENPSPGGQYLRRIAQDLGIDHRRTRENLKQLGYGLINDLDKGKVALSPGTEILGIEDDGRVWALDEDGRIEKHQAETIVLATGARERFLPFPGWTLPGVISTGAAQILMKSSGMLPGRAHVIGGAGPLPLAVAGEISINGGHVSVYWNQSSWARQMRFLTGCRYHFSKLAMGMKYLAKLFFSRTIIGHGLKVLEARGEGHLEQVVLARMDRAGHAIACSEKTYDVDCLAVGYGFVPNLELPTLAGCQLEYNAAKGGWVVKVNENLQTSVPTMFAAGELTGIAGAEKSIIEGELVGLAVARQIGASLSSAHKKMMRQLHKRRQQEMAFGALVNQSCRPLSGTLSDLPDTTVICRCEDITLGQIRQQIDNGFTSLDAIKKATNSGMGNCQGRTCGPILQEILSGGQFQTDEIQQPFSIRSPIKPLRLAALAEEHLSEDPYESQQA